MQQAWTLKDECDWEKTRMLCYYSGNAMFFSQPHKTMEGIFELPYIDGNREDEFEKLRKKIEQRSKEIALL